MVEEYHTSSSVSVLIFHLVWVTKYRNKALTSEIRAMLDQKIREICKENSCEVEALAVMPNHVHLEVVMPPWMSVTVLIKKLKGTTARWLFKQKPELRQSFYHNHLWSPSYFARTVGNCSEETIKHYVETQWERPFK
ncbi:IS200/IS605 family transposase [Lactobacillus crispatus]|jgi:putative transposase|uniref:IS200/IS605 family transposase n=1 Tax=Lactobacillus crispatus TaxID=47770 RepID=UPI0022E70813|nr:IS200/IS605 family transposase [Lactobacillus crispatus]